MSDHHDDISKEAWDAACRVVGGPDVFVARSVETIAQERIACAIDQARREGYAAGVRAAAEVAETVGVYPELNVWNGGPDWYKHARRIAKSIRALDGKGDGV